MSFRQSSAVWLARCSTLPSNLVFVRRADRAAEDGKCWPLMTSLAADCGSEDGKKEGA